MASMTPRLIAAPSSLALLLLAPACGDDDGGENTGATCQVADDCFTDIAREDIAGEIECLDRVPGGYCTHLCETDDDCCAADGECLTGFKQVCAPFESADDKRCFLSCEAEDVGDADETVYCQDNANEAFGCRSTGGGT